MNVPYFCKSTASINGVGIMFDSLLSPKLISAPQDVMHLHMVYELIVISTGSADVLTEDQQRISLREGDAALVCPKVYHVIFPSSENAQLFSLKFQLFRTEEADDPKAQSFHSLLSHLDQQTVVSLDNGRKILWILDQIRQQDITRVGAAELVNAYAAMILIYLIRSFSPIHSSLSPFNSTIDLSPRSVDMDRWAVIEQYVASHYKTPDISELAGIIAVSEQHLRRFLRSSYNMTFSQLVNRHRINISKRLLADATRSVYEIAEMVGYHSLQNFSVAFRKVTGQSASEYRAQCLKDKA